MKIRTITTGINAELPFPNEDLQRAVEATLEIKSAFENRGYTVQTVRLSTQPWEEFILRPEALAEVAEALENVLLAWGIDYFSLGTTSLPERVSALFEMIKHTQSGFCTVMAAHEKGIDRECIRETAKLIKRLAKINGDGFANLRFAACFNTPSGTPFFPAAYHRGPESFSIGLENSDLVYKAFSEAGDISRAALCLGRLLNREYAAVERIAKQAAKKLYLRYGGIDVSMAPSVKRQESFVFACEKLGLGHFGSPGTLAVAQIITQVLREVKVKKCGYSGLMLPVLEDFGLARRNSQGCFDIRHLLTYSAVCGTGLDTIPLPGDVSEHLIYALLLDIAALSHKLKKPLSARLMPIPGKKAGEMTEFDFPYFANTRVMSL